ncbi:hypothetical protein GOP47_0031176 [Adiantum capillus-veneris]|nr:hypothetical protein GOP47_0031176 [Adiantum capillus-veneris]
MQKLATFLENCCLPWRLIFGGGSYDQEWLKGCDESPRRAREKAAKLHAEEAFKAYDLDGDGRLSEEELYALLASLDSTLSRERSQSIFRQADIDHDGHIDLSEFRALLQSAEPEDDIEQLLADTFELYDLDRNGFIDAHELLQVVSRLSAICKSGGTSRPPAAVHNLDDCQRMIAAHDLNGDGRIDFKEFKTLLAIA